MAKHHKRLLVGIAVGIAVSAVAIGSSAINGRTSNTGSESTDKVRIVNDRTSNTGSESTDKVRVVNDRKLPEQWAINAAYGRGALSNLQAALTEIADDNVDEARKDVTVAHSLLVKIKPESPRTADFILIHSEERVLDDADPASFVQEKVDSIRRDFEVTDHEAIVAALDSLDVPQAYTRVDLPLTRTVTLVNEIVQALNSQDADRARDKLMEIGNGLRIETVHVGTDDSATDSGGEDDAG